MKIIPNYNLSFNQKTNNKQQTNPTFGINQKMISASLGMGTAAGIGAAIAKFIPISLNIPFLTQSGQIPTKQVQNLRDLPTDKFGYTHLHYLCKNGNLEDVKDFLEKNPDINLNQQTVFGDTYMSIAAYNNYDNIVNLIASKNNYDPSTPNINGWTDFHHLCWLGYTDIVKTLSEKHPEFDFNKQSIHGITCITLAARSNHADIVNFITTRDNYNPTIPEENGWTDFHTLCQYGYTNAVKTLAKKYPKFNFEKQTKYGSSCKNLADRYGHNDIFGFIFRRKKRNIF